MPKLKIDAAVSRQTVARNEDIVVRVTETNTSPGDIRVAADNSGALHAECDYIIHIHDEHGNVPGFTPVGEEFFHPTHLAFYGLQLKPLKPGEGRTETLLLNDFFVLEPRHTYHMSFTIRRQVKPVSAPPTSNWIAVTVE